MPVTSMSARAVRSIALRAAVTATATAVAVPSAAASTALGVFAPGSSIAAKTYEQRAGLFWSWLTDMPMHGPAGQLAQPIARFDGAVDCAYYQHGNVWYLASPLGSATSTVSRSCHVPAGTIVFVPVSAGWYDNLNYPGQAPTTYTLAQLRAMCSDAGSTFAMSATVDGLQ